MITKIKACDIIKEPILSENGMEGIKNKRYIFIVDKNANKTQIKEAVQLLFSVEVDRVNVINCKGKLKRQGRTQGYTSDYKKAIVQLTEQSDPIAFFEGMA